MEKDRAFPVLKAAGTCLLLFALAALPGMAGAGAGAETSDPSGLWQKALAVFQQNSDLLPHKMEVFSELLDRRGRTDTVSQFYFDIRYDGQGKSRSELTRAFKDGQDISAEAKKRFIGSDAPPEKPGAKKRQTFTFSMSDVPFNPERRHLTAARARPETQVLFGRSCRRFDISFRANSAVKEPAREMNWVGMAWLEEESGVPVKLEFSIEPLPKNVNSLWTIYRYELDAAGDWALREISVQGQGGFLFIKKGFRSTTRFSEYRRQTPEEGAK
jgi:hypothetical protein